jgi:hypothetical protein
VTHKLFNIKDKMHANFLDPLLLHQEVDRVFGAFNAWSSSMRLVGHTMQSVARFIPYSALSTLKFNKRGGQRLTAEPETR